MEGAYAKAVAWPGTPHQVAASGSPVRSWGGGISLPVLPISSLVRNGTPEQWADDRDLYRWRPLVALVVRVQNPGNPGCVPPLLAAT